MKLYEVVEFIGGTPQFRIKASAQDGVPMYLIYSQTDLSNDLTNNHSTHFDNKIIRTQDKVNTLIESDVLFSLISGEASIVSKEHEGYLYTHNYIKLIPDEYIDSKFLVYLINEDRDITRQLSSGLQGSQVMKHTLKQIKELEIEVLPTIEKQKIIGEIYFKQLRLQTIKQQVINLETTMVLKKLEEVNKGE